MHHPQLVINLSGGLVRDVFSSVPGLQVLVVDWDVGDSFPGEPSIVEVPLYEVTCAAHVRDVPVEPLSELAGTDTGTAVEAAYEQGVRVTTTAHSAAGEQTRQSFQCDRCGACCSNLIIEAVWLDCVREPRILKRSKLSLDDLCDDDRCVLLWDREKHHCPFLKTLRDRSCACAIYPTRPNVCVACEPGGPKCQQARLLGSLPVLRDVDGRSPDVDIWADDCEFDSDWLQEIAAEVLTALGTESSKPTATV